jgi:hypothetical protein
VLVRRAALRVRPRRSPHDVDGRDELVAPAVHRPDDRLAAAVVGDRLAHRLDARGERRLGDEAVAPHLVEQLLLADHASPPLHEIRQQVERLRFELDLLAVAAQHDPLEIELAVREAKDHAHIVLRDRGDDRR